VRVRNGMIETFPVKGTRARGATAADDERLRAELLGSAKEAAELNMITDLLRNDLGRVCTAGSVKVAAAREVMETPTVMHTYSHVTGALRADVQPIEALLSMFPGGSVTGCPKKRAMEIIDELEPTTRGAYCGSLVAIDPDGRLDSSVLIRTLVQKGDELYLQVGGGIVHRSDLDAEYEESMQKAQGLMRALKVSAR